MKSMHLITALGVASLLSMAPVAQSGSGQLNCSNGCSIRVDFKTITFPKLDDSTFGAPPCAECDQTAQAYGSFSAYTWDFKKGTAGVGPVKKLKLASWGAQPSSCPSHGVDWEDPNGGRAECFRYVYVPDEEVVGSTNGTSSGDPAIFFLEDTFLCAASSNAGPCDGPWAKHNNSITLTVKPGEFIELGALFYDYDSGSPDDVLCNPLKELGPFTAQQLATLNISGGMSTGFNGDGSCSIAFKVQVNPLSFLVFGQ